MQSPEDEDEIPAAVRRFAASAWVSFVPERFSSVVGRAEAVEERIRSAVVRTENC